MNVFEALRARAGGAQRLVAASSIAVFGGAVMPKLVTDATKQTSQTTYGVTKTITELLINDYSRKGFFDGRSARLPNIWSCSPAVPIPPPPASGGPACSASR